MPTPVAIVICTRDRPTLLEPAVHAALGALRDGDELVVVDSASTDPSAVAPARAEGVRTVRVDRPGLSRARNAGVAAATAPVVLFTDDDCRPAPGWVEALAAPFDRPEVGFTTGRALAEGGGRVTVSCMVDEEPRRLAGDADPFTIGVGANMAVRRVALDGVGGFDERLGAGVRLRAGEDVDLWWRLLHAGWEGAYVPDAVVNHVQWRTDAQALRLAYGYGLGAGALATKAIRHRRQGGGALLWRRLGADGIGRATRDLFSGYQTGAAAALLQAAGTVSGAVQALWWARDT